MSEQNFAQQGNFCRVTLPRDSTRTARVEHQKYRGKMLRKRDREEGLAFRWDAESSSENIPSVRFVHALRHGYDGSLKKGMSRVPAVY